MADTIFDGCLLDHTEQRPCAGLAYRVTGHLVVHDGSRDEDRLLQTFAADVLWFWHVGSVAEAAGLPYAPTLPPDRTAQGRTMGHYRQIDTRQMPRMD